MMNWRVHWEACGGVVAAATLGLTGVGLEETSLSPTADIEGRRRFLETLIK